MDNQRKKELLAAYKERKQVGGVYQIYNQQADKGLLLSAVNLEGSRNHFAFSQKTGSCVTMKLQKDWNRYGGEAFSFQVLEELEKKPEQTPEEFAQELKLLEELWRERLQPLGKLY